MDSQITLINPAPGAAPHNERVSNILTFSRDVNMVPYLTVRDARGETVYAIDTGRFLSGFRTTFHAASASSIGRGAGGGKIQGRLIATIARNDLLPDTVSFHHSHGTGKEEKVRAERWLTGKRDEIFPASFQHASTTYTWSVDDPTKARFGPTHPSLSLTSSNTTEVLALYNPSKDRLSSSQDCACLQLSEVVTINDALRDRALVSCVLVLQRWMGKHREAPTLPAEAGMQSFLLGAGIVPQCGSM